MNIIIITERQNDYKAHIKYYSNLCGCGRSRNEAIGDLVLSHKDIFQIKDKYINKRK